MPEANEVSESIQVENAKRLLVDAKHLHALEADAIRQLKTRAQFVMVANSTVFGLVVSNITSESPIVQMLLLVSLIFLVSQFMLAVGIWSTYSTYIPGTTDDKKLWNNVICLPELQSILSQISVWGMAAESEKRQVKVVARELRQFLRASIASVIVVMLAFFLSKIFN